MRLPKLNAKMRKAKNEEGKMKTVCLCVCVLVLREEVEKKCWETGKN